jgi:type IV pilus assembly protein PilM
VRWELPAQADKPPSSEELARAWTAAIAEIRESYKFRGREAVVSLRSDQLWVQNVRVPKLAGADLERAIQQEAAARLPFPLSEAELRYWQAGDVRQGDATRREVILLACHRPVLDRALSVVIDAGLTPVAVDVEPAALVRSYRRQYRRDDDREQRTMYVHLGATSTVVVIARDAEILFVKYLEVFGRQMDEAVARHLKMGLGDAAALRRNNGDRRVELQDPEVTRGVAEATRPVVEQLLGELSRCLRYHSVTYRGQPVDRLVLGGGEATQGLLDALTGRIELKCELGDPLRSFDGGVPRGRRGQWDVALGLALRSARYTA